MRLVILAAAIALSACSHAAAVSETAAPPVIAAPAPAPGHLTLTVTGVRAGAGPVMVAVFDEAGWNGEGGPVAATMIDAAAASVTHTFEQLPAGLYGVRLYQDVDANGQLNANPFGIPIEPFGFSNNAPVRFGPPAWGDAAFPLAGDTAHTIDLPQ